MNVNLYNYSGENERVDKSSGLSLVLSVTGQFKDAVSVIYPKLLLDVSSASNIFFNYVYIQEMARYYFVTDIVLLSSTLVEVSLKVDPLMSYKTGILAQKTMIARSESAGTTILYDSKLPLQSIKQITEEVPSSGGFKNITFKTDFDNPGDTKNIMVTTAGQSGYGFTIPALGDLPIIKTESFSDAGGTTYWAMTRTNLLALTSALMGSQSAKASFFVSAVAFPFEVESDNTNVPMGMWEKTGTDPVTGLDTFTYSPISGVSAYYGYSSSSYKIIADFVVPYSGDFLDLEPYALHEIWIPFYGWKEISFKDNMDDRILVYYAINYQDGSAMVTIYNYTRKRELFSASCQIGIRLAISSTNAQELEAQKNAMKSNLILGLVSSAISIGAGGLSGNAMGMIYGGLQGVQQVTNYINQSAQMFTRAQSTNAGAMTGLYTYLDVRIRTTKSRRMPFFNATEYNHEYGLPLMEFKTLSTLSGFCQVDDIHLTGIGQATDTEKEMIVASLKEGVIL